MGKPIGCDPALLRSASESACMDCFQRNIYQDSHSRYRKTVLQQPLFLGFVYRYLTRGPEVVAGAAGAGAGAGVVPAAGAGAGAGSG